MEFVRNMSDKFTIIRDLYRFLQPGLIFSMLCPIIMSLIHNDFKQVPRIETQISFKNFPFQQ